MRQQTKAISSDSTLPWFPVLTRPTVRIEKVRVGISPTDSARLGFIGCDLPLLRISSDRLQRQGEQLAGDYLLPSLPSSVYITDRIADKSERTPRFLTCRLLIGKTNIQRSSMIFEHRYTS